MGMREEAFFNAGKEAFFPIKKYETQAIAKRRTPKHGADF